MQESWRWFGPEDAVRLEEAAQAGARGIVTALHDIPYGEVWEISAIAARKAEIAAAGCGLHWAVVESLPVHEAIKLGEGDLPRLFAAYRQSLANLAACGVRVVCYNFMPLLDWTRTDLAAPLPAGGTALRFDAVRMAAFDCFLLQRPGAEADWPAPVVAAARAWADTADEAARATLLAAINAGLPGAYPRYGLADMRAALARYAGMGRDDLRARLADFLRAVVPTAEDLGMRLCIHPDDPPFDVLGLPRIVSTQGDIAHILDAVPSPANGLTLCSGSLTARADNDLPAIARAFGPRIHFAHLRNVTREADGSFQESAHLDGDTDMVALIAALLAEEARRRAEGRADAEIPFRPDHGHALADDLRRPAHPGYTLVGRLRGLAELRGVIRALSHPLAGGTARGSAPRQAVPAG